MSKRNATRFLPVLALVVAGLSVPALGLADGRRDERGGPNGIVKYQVADRHHDGHRDRYRANDRHHGKHDRYGKKGHAYGHDRHAYRRDHGRITVWPHYRSHYRHAPAYPSFHGGHQHKRYHDGGHHRDRYDHGRTSVTLRYYF